MQTNVMHLSGNLTQDWEVKAKTDKHRVTTLSGNSVSIDQELQTMNQATMGHAEMTKIYKKFTEILKMPLRS